MTEPGPRQVTLVLCGAGGEVVGALPPFEVEVPWWQDVETVVSGARRAHDVDVVVLRLLEGDNQDTFGGRVTYLAEINGAAPPPGLRPWEGELTPHPLRLPWAEPGGPAADLAWADAALAARDTPRTGEATQTRTWNLSSLWRLPTDVGTTWLKVVPPFFAHEGDVIDRLRSPAAPVLLAADRPRVLLEEIPGDDLYGADLDTCVALVALLVGIQVEWIDRIGELEAIGAPDWRPAPLLVAAVNVVERTAGDLDAGDRRSLVRLLDGWDDRMARIAECGIPDSLVHGDFHPGNARGDGHRLTILDWGDSGIGHPLLDEAAFVERADNAHAAAVREAWTHRWREAAPGSDPRRAAELLDPVAAIRQAVIYQVFLDQIEPAERVYHRRDPAVWLRRAASLG